ANEAGSTFQCQLDGGGYSACASPQTYAGLGDGSHTFQVRAIDAVGHPDASPASHSWTVDTAAPETSITSGPADPTVETDAVFVFGANEAGSTFECSLDGATFTVCSSPATYLSLDTGAHLFEARAIDPAGNVDPTPAPYGWTIS
ncbi:MAG TPA: hypothetical protein VNB88_08050, partial [Gaiellaceae bacterium]|nr:hypothetical protein [Gaiellaceae bacterium]